MPNSRPILRLDLEQDRPGRHQVEAWRENVAPLWEVSVRDENAARFRGSSDVFHLGSAILGLTKVSGHRTQRSPALIARMGVDHILVQCRESGKYHAEADGAVRDAGPGDVCLFDMTRPLTAWSSDYSAVTLALPRVLVASMLDVDAVHGTVIRGTTPLGALAAEHLRALKANAPRFSPEEAAAAARGTGALLAACAGPRGAARDGIRATAKPAILLTLRRHIEANLADPRLTIDQLARRFGLSRSALYRAFEPFGGVAGYIRRRRLAGAYRELASVESSHLPRIEDVARRWQFRSPAGFTHAFRREFGAAPAEVRAEALGGRSTPISVAAHQDWRELYKWVLDLA